MPSDAWPPQLEEWVTKCLEQMNDANRAEAQAELRQVIADAFAAKTFWTTDWARVQLQSLLPKSPPTLESKANEPQIISKKAKKKGAQKNGIPPLAGTRQPVSYVTSSVVLQRPKEHDDGPQSRRHRRTSDFNNSAPPPDLTRHIVRTKDQHVAGGAFGDVYRCQYQVGDSAPQQVAVKALRFGCTIDGDTKDRSAKMLRRELGIWRRLSHNNVVPFLGIAYGFGMEGAISLVSLWMPNDSLHTFIATHGGKLDTVHQLQILFDVAKGLRYLHSFPIIHGDLSSNNVLLDADYSARLADFGYASLAGDIPEAMAYLQRSTARPGALRWIAPEQLYPEQASHLTTKSDIYSFGCICLQVLSGKQPWSEVGEDMAILFCLIKGRNPARPESRTMDDSHWEFIQRCWSSPRDRPEADMTTIIIEQFIMYRSPSRPLRDLFTAVSSQALSLADETNNQERTVGSNPAPAPPPQPLASSSMPLPPQEPYVQMYRAGFSFQGQEGEMSLQKDDVVELVEKDENGWWLVKKDGEEGWAPNNYLELVPKKPQAPSSAPPPPVRRPPPSAPIASSTPAPSKVTTVVKSVTADTSAKPVAVFPGIMPSNGSATLWKKSAALASDSDSVAVSPAGSRPSSSLGPKVPSPVATKPRVVPSPVVAKSGAKPPGKPPVFMAPWPPTGDTTTAQRTRVVRPAPPSGQMDLAAALAKRVQRMAEDGWLKIDAR